MRTRDQQRQRVYRSEWPIWEKTRKVETVPEMQETVDRWLDAPGYIIVLDGRGRRSAVSYGREISIPRSCRNEIVLCHEIAHTFNYRLPAHGPEFAGTLLGFCQRFISREIKDALRSEYIKNRVKISHEAYEKALRRSFDRQRAWAERHPRRR